MNIVKFPIAERIHMADLEAAYQRALDEGERMSRMEASIIHDCELGKDLGWLEWVDDAVQLVAEIGDIAFRTPQGDAIDQVSLIKEKLLQVMRMYAQNEAERQMDFL